MAAVRFGRPTRGQAVFLAVVTLFTALVAFAVVRVIADPGPPTPAAGTPSAPSTPDSGLPRIAVADLPPEARDTLALIDAGGPYPYRQDNTVFANREGVLPAHAAGYYREYTVPTPGSEDRRPRRLVVGTAGDTYYTADHFQTFRQLTR